MSRNYQEGRNGCVCVRARAHAHAYMHALVMVGIPSKGSNIGKNNLLLAMASDETRVPP